DVRACSRAIHCQESPLLRPALLMARSIDVARLAAVLASEYQSSPSPFQTESSSQTIQSQSKPQLDASSLDKISSCEPQPGCPLATLTMRFFWTSKIFSTHGLRRISRMIAERSKEACSRSEAAAHPVTGRGAITSAYRFWTARSEVLLCPRGRSK